MENQKNNSNLKAIVAILAVLLVGSLVYIFKMTSDAKALQTELTSTKTDKASVMKDLEELKATYDAAIAENTSMSDELIAEREKHVKKIEDRLLKSYQKIRDNSMNGLAVVHVSRGACGGCFSIVPPQRQADIRERKKLIVCEHCGRILADVESVEPVHQRR